MIDFGAILRRKKTKPDLQQEFADFKATFETLTARRTVLPMLIEYSGLKVPAPDTDNLFAQGRAAGRRDMMLFIEYHLNLEVRDIFDMVKSNPLKPEDIHNG